MKKFLDTLDKFVKTKTDDERKALFNLLPEHILKNKDFFDNEMFVDSSKHTFYIITSLFIDWIFELEECVVNPKENRLLNELHELFEYLDDDISEIEQKKVIVQTQELLSKFYEK